MIDRLKVIGFISLLSLNGCYSPRTKYFDTSINASSEFSVVVGTILSQKHIGWPQCPENLICMNVVFENIAGNVTTIGGPTIPRRFRVKYVTHGAWPRKPKLAMIVQKVRMAIGLEDIV